MNVFKENEKNREKRALSLWMRWFKRSGEPMYKGHDTCCFFCGHVQWPPSKHPKHRRDCIYLEAKELLGL